MAYNKTTWETGDVITAEKLNNAENGIAAAASTVGVYPIIVEYSGNTATLNKKYSEIYAALASGQIGVIYSDIDGEYACEFVNGLYLNTGDYTVRTSGDAEFTTDSEGGYPSITTG